MKNSRREESLGCFLRFYAEFILISPLGACSDSKKAKAITISVIAF